MDGVKENMAVAYRHLLAGMLSPRGQRGLDAKIFCLGLVASCLGSASYLASCNDGLFVACFIIFYWS